MVPPSVQHTGQCGRVWHAYTALVCTGVGDRGLAYATYELSHAVLGVDPQAYWVEAASEP